MAAQDYPFIKPIVESPKRDTLEPLAVFYKALEDEVSSGELGKPSQGAEDAKHQLWDSFTDKASINQTGQTDNKYYHSESVQEFIARVERSMWIDIAQKILHQNL